MKAFEPIFDFFSTLFEFFETSKGRYLSSSIGLLIVGYLTLKLVEICHFGIQMGPDEPYFLIPGFKLLPMGDLPFLDDITNGARHHDFLNYLLSFVIPFDVLFLRQLSVVFLAMGLFVLTILSFGNRFGIVAALVFGLCFYFDTFNLFSWSAQWWARHGLIWHQILLFLFLTQRKRHYLFLAGIVFGVSCIAHNPLLVIALVSFLWLLLFARDKKLAYLYGLGVICALSLDAFYISYHGLWGELANSWRIALDQRSQMNVTSSPMRFLGLIDYAVREWSFVPVVLTLFVLLPFPLSHNSRFKKYVWPSRRTYFVLLVLVGLFMTLRFDILTNLKTSHRTFVMISFYGGVWLLLRARQQKNIYLGLMVITALGSMAIMGYVSVSGSWSFLWALPAVFIPFMGDFLRSANEVFKKTPERSLGFAVLCILLFWVGLQTFRHRTQVTYEDVDQIKCTHELKMPPLKGIKTNERRAFLINKLYELSHGNQFAISLGVPGYFFFNSVRSSVPSIIAGDIPNGIAGKASIRYLVNQNRIPEIAIVIREHTNDWGVRRKFYTPPQKELLSFVDCIADEVILDFPEFFAVKVDPSKVSMCTRLVN